MTAASCYHGVLITFRRPDEVRNFLNVLRSQTARLDSLIVVDNDDDPAIADIVGTATDVAGQVRYLGVAENMGPAGGIDAGIAAVLAHACDDDWIVLLDDDDPPLRDSCLEEMRGSLQRLCDLDDATAAIGLWGASLDKASGRVRAASGNDPEEVDYLPGSALPHYSAGAVRAVGAPEAAMFFGFDDLELGLRLRDAGYNLYSSGRARAHGLAHMVEGRVASARLDPPTWRRYYSLRNSIIVLRRHGAARGALFRSVVAGLGKPLANLPRTPRLAMAHLGFNVRAIRDGWLGRLGKTIDPAGLPAPRRNAAPR